MHRDLLRSHLSNSIRSTATLAFAAVLLALCASTAQAQFRANLQGTITDPSGAVVVGATVTLTSNETGRVQTATTTDEGFYRFAQLAPGSYTVNASQTGFNSSQVDDFTIAAEETQGLDLTLTTGGVAETVTVTGETASALQTEDGSVSRSISTEEVRSLPQVGRDPYELLRLTPGVFGDGARGGGGGAVNLPNTTGPGGSNNSIFQTENQVQISANGQRLSSNNFQIDGVSVNSFNWGGAALVTPNQESVKEVRVLSSSYSAEDGRNSGAQIRVVSQNGTNEFHGSAFFKYNSPKLNAFNKYAGPNNAARVRVNDYIRQFGGSFGGPLYLPRFGEGGPATYGGKDKLFFFTSYEGLRNNSSNTSGAAYVETAQYRQLVQQLRPGGVTAQVFGASGIAPRIVNVLTPSCRAFGNDPTRCRVVNGGLDIGSLTGALGQYVSINNQPQGGGFDGIPDIQEIQFALPNQNRGNQYNGRIDYVLNERNSFAASTYITKQNNLGSDGSAAGRPISDLPSKPTNLSGTLLYNAILSPTMLNEARLNGTRFAQNQQEDAINTNFGIPRIEVEGLPFDRIRFGAPRAENTPGIFAQNIFEFSDTLSKVVGNHALKFGVVIRNEQDNSDQSGGARPIYSFFNLFNLANDTPIFEGINADPRTGLPADSQRYFTTKYYAGFVQDDFKARPNLTLNFGLRYEYYSPLQEKDGRLSNLFLGSQGLLNSQVRAVDQLSDPDRNNFAPRVGFAYSPGFSALGNLINQERTVIRGGFGVAYNRVPVAPLANVRGNTPFFARYNICCGTSAQDFSTPFAGGQILYALGANNSVTSYPRNPALGQGINPTTGAPNSGSVEIYGAPQDLPNPYVYTYSMEVQQELPAKFTATVGYQGSAGHKLIRLVNQNFLSANNPAFFAVFFTQPDVNSNYNALNTSLSRRFSNGLQFQGNYRFSKSIDQLSYEGPGFVTNQTYPQDNSTERGPSDFDVRHFATISGLYELPFFNTPDSFVGKVLGGFSVSSIVTYRTGFPFTPVVDSFTSTPGGANLSPVRPQGYTGTGNIDTSEEAFINGTSIPGGGSSFVVFRQADGSVARPGIGRNSFRGPNYFNVDMSFFKRTGLPSVFGEGAHFEIKANVFNIFNLRNLSSFAFGSGATTVGRFDTNSGQFFANPDFGRATGGFSGRVVELQGRFRF